MTDTVRGSGRSYRTLAALLEYTAQGRRCYFITQDPWQGIVDSALKIARGANIPRLQVHGDIHCFQITSAVTMIVRPDRVLNEMEQSVRGRLGSLYAVDHYVTEVRLLGAQAQEILQAFPKKVLERIDV